MRKIFSTIIILMTFFLVSCSYIQNDEITKLSDEEMKTEIDNLLNASYIESSLSVNFRTEELNVEFEPLLTTKALMTENGTITSIHYDSSLLKGLNISPFEMIMDETSNMMYLYYNYEWIKIDIIPLLSNEDDMLDDKIYMQINKIIQNMLINFKSSTYVDTITYKGQNLVHYEVKIDTLKTMQDIIFLLNEEASLDLPDLVILLQDYQDLTDILKSFVLDIYINGATKEIARIEIDSLQLLEYFIFNQAALDEHIPDKEEFRNYFKDIEIAVNYSNINAQSKIEISDEAKRARLVSLDDLMNIIDDIDLPNSEIPMITLIGDQVITLDLGEPYIDLGATAYDKQEGDISNRIITNGYVNTNIEGVYKLLYVVTDIDGNTTKTERTIIVAIDPSIDREPPKITLNGDEVIDLYIGDEYNELGATAIDDFDGDLTSDISISGTVNTEKEGTYYITYSVSDSSNNKSSITRMVNVSLRPLDPSSKEVLNFKFSESLMHPNGSVIYFLDTFNKKLIEYNIETKDTKSVTFNLTPEKMTFSNDKIYVTLLKGQHSSYWWEEEQQGAYAVVNANDFSDYTVYDILIDPFDISVDKDGFVYIPSGSGQWTDLNIYNTNGEKVARGFIRQQSYIIYNKVLNKMYLVDTDSSPRDIETLSYNSIEGKVFGYDTPYHGDYTFKTSIFISPDGQFIFNNSGVILTCHTLRNEDMKYVVKLNHDYQDIAFNTVGNEFYLLNNEYVYIYDYDTLTYKSFFKMDTSGKSIYYQNNTLYILGLENNNNSTYIKTYDLN